MFSRVVTPRKKTTRDIREGYQFKPAYVHTTRPYVHYFRSQEEVDRFPFDPGYIGWGLRVLHHNLDNGEGYYERIPPGRVRTKDVFLTESILPYIITLKRAECGRELDLLSPEVQAKPSRVPALYRITDKAVVDDYGRFYTLNSRGFWELYKFNIGPEMRADITLPGNSRKSISRPCYFFSALAGYNPTDQNNFLFSQQFQFHHVEENRLDIRPSRVVPLEYRIHQYIHSNDIQPEHRGYFSYSKWIDV